VTEAMECSERQERC